MRELNTPTRVPLAHTNTQEDNARQNTHFCMTESPQGIAIPGLTNDLTNILAKDSSIDHYPVTAT